MNIKKILNIFGILFIALILSGCGSKYMKKYDKPFKHNVPLIKDKAVVNLSLIHI